MAILNIKNLPDYLSKKLQARAKRWYRSLAQEVTHRLSDAKTSFHFGAKGIRKRALAGS